MNYTFLKLSYWTIALSVLLVLTNCTKEDNYFPDPVEMLEVDRTTGISIINYSNARATLYNLPYEVLTFKEETGIKSIKQAEKLLVDFHDVMSEKWSNPSFLQLYKSEKTHYNAASLLLNKYELTDPVQGLTSGEFSRPEMTKYYHDLVNQGSLSLDETYRMTGEIHETNITIIKNQLTNITNNTDTRLFYKNLLAAKKNHFRIVVQSLEKSGIQYIPQVMSQDEYQKIMRGSWDMKPTDQ